jgi:hypothetical protein
VNVSQSKFLTRTWPMSQLRSNAPLFWLDQDHVAIEKLLAVGTELGNLESQWKTTIDASKVTCETMVAKIKSTSNSRPHTYFTEYLVGVTENSPPTVFVNSFNPVLFLSHSSFLDPNATSVMVPCAPPTVTPLLVLRSDWETLASLASW